MKKIAVYGSLKKGFYNYRESMGEPIAHSTVFGAMFLAYSYPHLYSVDDSEDEHIREHPVEIYEVDDESYRGIHGMEIGAGYKAVEMEFEAEGGGMHTATIFFYNGKSANARYQFIEGYNAETVPHALRN